MPWPARFAGVALAAVLAATASAQATPPPASAAANPSGAASMLQLVHEGHTGAVQASGTVNAVDPVRRTVNLSHGSIKALGWPAMTMDFPVAEDVDLAALKPGMGVSFTLVHGNSGGMNVDAIRPAANDGR